MHLGSSRHRGSPRARSRWARATWAPVVAVTLAACGTVKAETCSTVHTRILEELRTADGAARNVLDPWACEWHAGRLRALVKELRALELPEGMLHTSVDAYAVELERVAEAYERLAAAYRNSEELPPEEAAHVHAALSRGVLDHAASLNALRTQVQHACNL